MKLLGITIDVMAIMIALLLIFCISNVIFSDYPIVLKTLAVILGVKSLHWLWKDRVVLFKEDA